MPITQARMLEVVTAASKILDHAKSIADETKFIRQNQVQHAINTMSAEVNLDIENNPRDKIIYEQFKSVLDVIDQIVEKTNNIIDFKTLLIIGKEQSHFAARGKSNDWAREHRRKKRNETASSNSGLPLNLFDNVLEVLDVEPQTAAEIINNMDESVSITLDEVQYILNDLATQGRISKVGSDSWKIMSAAVEI
jgi:hypothetical protein